MPNSNRYYAMTSPDVKSYESAIFRVGDNRTNMPNSNRYYAMTSRDIKSYESAILRDNRANIPNANIDYATTSRDVQFTNPPFCEWAIIGQASQTLIMPMQRLPET